MSFKKLFTLLAFLFFVISLSFGQSTWVGGSGVGAAQNDWNNANNWTPVGVPSGVAVSFTAGTISCNLPATSVSVTSLTINGYTGTITQGSGSLLITGTTGLVINTGAFTGSNQSISTTKFTQTGGTFTSTSGTLTTSGNVSFTSGTFIHNSGILFLNVPVGGAPITVSGNATLNNVVAQSDYAATGITISNNLIINNLTLDSSSAFFGATFKFTVSTNITVNGQLTLMGNKDLNINTGTVYCKGDIALNGTYTSMASTGTIEINGLASQNLSSTATSSSYQSAIPSVVISKPSGTLNLSGHITTHGPSWTYSSGTISAGTSTVYFYHSTSTGNITVTGSHSLNNAYFSSYFSSVETVTGSLAVNNLVLDASASPLILAVSVDITVNGTLTLQGTNDITLNTGIVYAKGDITLNGTSSGGGGSGTIQINGTSTQALNGASAMKQCTIPKVVISKPSGTTLNMNGHITTIGPTWTYTSGIINPGTSTVYFYHTSIGSTYTITGDHTLYDVVVMPAYGTQAINGNLIVNNLKIDATGGSLNTSVLSTITVNGTLTLAGDSFIKINTGTIYAKGDVTLSNTTSTGGGSGTIQISGPNNQTITGNTTSGNCIIPNVIVDKSAGTASFKNTTTVDGNWTYVQGLVDATTFTSTVFFNKTTGSPFIDGQGASSTMAFYSVRLSYGFGTFTLNGNLDVNGNLNILASTTLNTSASNYAVNVAGNFTKAASATFTSNASTLTFDGASNQSLTLNTAVYNITLLKGGGTLSPVGPVIISNSLVLTTGTITTTTTNTLTLNNGVLCSLGNASSYVDGPMKYIMAATGPLTLNFPVGKNGVWRAAQLTVTHSSTASITYTAELMHSSAYALGYALPPTFDRVSGIRYWQIDRSSSASFTSGTIKLYYGTDDDAPDAAVSLGVAKSAGNVGPWSNITSLPGTANGTGTITSSSFPAMALLNQFSIANLTGGLNPLPLTFSSFKGNVQQGKINLIWTTESELQNDYFEIQRSHNGVDFYSIGKILSKGDQVIQSSNSYSFEDFSPFPGTNYYTVKQVDYDEKESYTPIILIKIKLNFSVFPNPVLTQFNINLDSPPTTDVVISVKSLAGIELLHQVISKEQYQGIITVDTNQLKSGVYFLEVSYDQEKAMTKLYVQ
jgi:hypothetical protein